VGIPGFQEGKYRQLIAHDAPPGTPPRFPGFLPEKPVQYAIDVRHDDQVKRKGEKSMTKSRRFAVGLVQMSMGPRPAGNIEKCAGLVESAAAAGAQVVVLPELPQARYFCQREDASLFDLAEAADGPTVAAMARVAKARGVAVVAPFFERRAAGLYHNSLAVIDADGSVLGVYRKMHIPDDPSYYEKYYFTPGDLGFRCFRTRFGAIGTLICWDQWYPEAARLTAMLGAELLVYPTAIGWHPHEKAEQGAAQRDAWMTVQRGHAVANGLYVAAANRVGLEAPPEAGAGIEFWGSSFLADPQGQLLAEGSTDREEILVSEVDCGRIEDVRRNWPFLRDRRIDAFAPITARFLDHEPFGGRR
jgi:N-carbamoylputrescine amidase